MSFKIRDMLIERFTKEFGRPSVDEEDCAWSIARTSHAPLNIRINSTNTSESVAVWLFDPQKPGTSSTERSWVKHDCDIERMVHQIKTCIHNGA